MSSLLEALEELKEDLGRHPVRIAAHSDIPFAVFRYPPSEEFSLRRHLRLLAVNLEKDCSRSVLFISLARLAWETAELFGIDDLFKTESLRGFDAAQRHIGQLLSSKDFKPAEESILEKTESLDPDSHCVFLVRSGGFSPAIHRTSALLGALENRTRVPMVLFYPGSLEFGTDLRFYDLPSQGGLGAYNYRVKIYGGGS
jgi:hypothetical protein